MKKDFNSEDLIDKYLHGTLSAAEQEAFTRRREADATFAEELRFQEDLVGASGILGREELKGQLQALEAQHYSRPKPRLGWKRLAAIAASVALLVTVSSLFYANQQYGNDALAKQYYDLPNYGGSRGEADIPNPFDQAIGAFYEQDYSTVISLLESGGNTAALDTDARSLLAHAYFHQGNPSAVLVLTRQVDNDTNLEWLRILSYLQINDTAEVQRQINNILRQDQHPLRLKARALQEKLGSKWRSFTLE